MMSIAERFRAYADAFEETLIDDNRARLEAFFTWDAVSRNAFGQVAHGRAAVIANLRAGVEGLDRRMDTRTLEFDPPLINGNSIQHTWRISFTRAGCPALAITGRETAVFQGDRIRSLSDHVEPTELQAVTAWMTANGARLRPEPR